jgi:ABC-type lipoprotein release transport system permease subunit
LTGLGLLLGLAAALLASRALSGLLFGVQAWDPATFVLVPLVLVVSATAAALAPSWRAARIDPVEALRAE